MNNQDATFKPEEQKLFLKSITRLLGFEKVDTMVNTEDMKSYIQGKLREKSLEERIVGKKWFNTGTIDSNELVQELKKK